MSFSLVMGSVYSEGSDERRGRYSPSADVSESEERGGASSSTAFSRCAALTPTFTLPLVRGKDVVVWDEEPHKRSTDLAEIDMMKERFAKLLLGEDMSGGGKGVCSALAISNAITNLSASIFGELWRLEPMASQKKSMWRREMEWLLSVSDSIVELVPSIRQFPGGGEYEVMATRPRSDLNMNLPALKKLDTMLISILDRFRDTEFWYVDRGIVVGDKYTSGVSGRPSVRQEEKWWLPAPKVPGKGLSEDSRKRLQQSRDCTNQILKAAMAINSNVLAEMAIPTAYIETLPKNGRDCLGDIIYSHITADQFSPECLLDCLDLSSEHHTLDVTNRIEAAVHVWTRKERKNNPIDKEYKPQSWGGKVKGMVADGEKNRLLAQRAETLLQIFRLRFPRLPQTALDMSKIQYNKDVGHAIIESYSRVMESSAFNIITRIDDVLYVDDATNRCAATESISICSRSSGFNGLPMTPFSIQHTPYASPFATPSIFSSPFLPSSPCSLTPGNKTALHIAPNTKIGKVVPAGLDKLWSFARILGSRRFTQDDLDGDWLVERLAEER